MDKLASLDRTTGLSRFELAVVAFGVFASLFFLVTGSPLGDWLLGIS